MRPCNKCGTPIDNRWLHCKKCEVEEPAAPATVTQEGAQTSRHSPTRKELFGLTAEVTIRALMAACPITAVLGLVLILVLPVASALIVAAVLGALIGLGWTMLEMYFQSGPH